MRRVPIGLPIVGFLLGSLLLSTPFASAQTVSTSLPGISVIGSGQATAPAETATVMLILGSNYYEDQASGTEPITSPPGINDETIQPVVDAIIGAGVPADEVQVIANPYAGDFGPSGAPLTIAIRIDIDQPTVAGITQILDPTLAATKDAGLYANFVGVIYGVKDCAGLELQARKNAIADARDTAARQADLLDVILGKVTASQHDPYSASMYGAAGGYAIANACTLPELELSINAADSAPAFDPGLPAEVAVVVNVEITFEIKDVAAP